MITEKEIMDMLKAIQLETLEEAYNNEAFLMFESEATRARLGSQISSLKSMIKNAREAGNHSAAETLERELSNLRSKKMNEDYETHYHVVHKNDPDDEKIFTTQSAVDTYTNKHGAHNFTVTPKKSKKLTFKENYNGRTATTDEIRAKNPNETVHNVGTKVTHKPTSLGGHPHTGQTGVVNRVEDHGAGMIAHYVRWPKKRKDTLHWGSWLTPIKEDVENLDEARYFVHKHWPELNQFSKVGKKEGYKHKEDAEAKAKHLNDNKDKHEIDHHYKVVGLGGHDRVAEEIEQVDENKKYEVWHKDIHGRAGTSRGEIVKAKSKVDALKNSETVGKVKAVGGKQSDIYVSRFHEENLSEELPEKDEAGVKYRVMSGYDKVHNFKGDGARDKALAHYHSLVKSEPKGTHAIYRSTASVDGKITSKPFKAFEKGKHLHEEELHENFSEVIEEEFKVGDKVSVHPEQYPHMKYTGVIKGTSTKGKKWGMGGQYHKVEYEHDSMLGGKTKTVNTFHHKELKKLSENEEVIQISTNRFIKENIKPYGRQDFDNGALLKHEHNDSNHMHMHKQHGVYHIKGFKNNKHFTDTAQSHTEAMKKFKAHKTHMIKNAEKED